VRWAAILAATMLVLNVAYVRSHFGGLHKARHVLETDHYRYIEMALGPDARPELAREAPFCWRVAVPVLARGLASLGLDLNVGFYLITNLSLFAFLVSLFLFLRDIGLPRPAAGLGIALTGLIQGAVRWYEYQYWMTDPACLFLVVAALRLLRADRRREAAAVGTLAAITRETSIILYPFYLVRTWRLRSLREAWTRTAAVAVAQAYVYVETRLFEMGMSVYQPANVGVVLAMAAIWIAGRLTASIGSARRSRARSYRSA
jgi:hypothetical protein